MVLSNDLTFLLDIQSKMDCVIFGSKNKAAGLENTEDRFERWTNLSRKIAPRVLTIAKENPIRLPLLMPPIGGWRLFANWVCWSYKCYLMIWNKMMIVRQFESGLVDDDYCRLLKLKFLLRVRHQSFGTWGIEQNILQMFETGRFLHGLIFSGLLELEKCYGVPSGAFFIFRKRSKPDMFGNTRGSNLFVCCGK